MTAAAALASRAIAHRGLHDRSAGVIENTLGAAKAAIAKGFAIECDVQWTADGEAVVFHDFTLDRLTAGAGRTADFTAAALAGVAMKDTDDRIPTLRALLDLIAGRVPLIVEIKSAFRGDLRLASRTVEILRDYAGPVGIKSFDPAMTIEARRLSAGRIPCGVVAMLEYNYADYEGISQAEKHALANLLHFRESRPDFISWKVDDLPCAAPFLCRAALGLPLMSWTVRTPEQRDRAAAHADQMVFEGFVPES
ncbi:MAG: glycerophosphodiester phosphodiesterase [Rhizobiales bacterium 65-9]|nr:glycerophosphodiester phosphodiesterase [Hyphomicrobiales bacterium]OJY34001.1 MAG: glycerophosphodiester phosphodiesterase [Rhizobiales bacterium 65-9]